MSKCSLSATERSVSVEDAPDRAAQVAPRQPTEQQRNELLQSLYDSIGPKILALGHRFLAGRSQDAEELVSETFARVIVGLPGFRGESSYSTWIYRIAMNVIADWLRTRPHLSSGMEPEAADLTSELEGLERAQLVHRALATLNPSHRMVLTLIAMEGMPHRQAAELLGVREGTLWSRYGRARIALAKRLQELGFTAD